MVLRMLARGTVRKGRKNGISIQSEVFRIQIRAGNENFIANGLHYLVRWMDHINEVELSIRALSNLLFFFFVIVEILQK